MESTEGENEEEEMLAAMIQFQICLSGLKKKK